ncbi:MAG: histidinol dehydrogenase [Pseudomonadota bacterium]|nr:histidinol dehydrogenase [Pseudomonadota bacterium]
MKKLIWNSLTPNEQVEALERPAMSIANIKTDVSNIIKSIKVNGDDALYELSSKYDDIELESLKVTKKELDQAEKRVDQNTIKALKKAFTNIKKFHQEQVPRNIAIEIDSGVMCERIALPIEKVGLYIPAGSAPLPSTVLMLGIPAQIAKCQIKVMCSPAQQDGKCNPEILYSAKLCGINEVYKIGGAQAIAAMAYGTESIPKVDKIFGPGNAWVTEAKLQVSEDPNGAAKDMPAGPSELLIIADKLSNPNFIAADLLSQAEHGVDSQVMLITDDEKTCDNVISEIKKQITSRNRIDIINESLISAKAILVDDLAMAINVSNQYAPEHLILNTSKPRDLLPLVLSAGSIFLGPWSPESVGDYCSGTNHVLPTYGYAKSSSSLGVTDFMKFITVQELTEEGIKKIGQTAIEIANKEGLDAHSYAVETRLKSII